MHGSLSKGVLLGLVAGPSTASGVPLCRAKDPITCTYSDSALDMGDSNILLVSAGMAMGRLGAEQQQGTATEKIPSPFQCKLYTAYYLPSSIQPS